MAMETKGNTQFGQTTELGQGPTTGERRAWGMPHEPLPEREREVSVAVVSGGSITQAIGGIAAIVLTIIAMTGVAPTYLMAVAAIVAGGALLIESGSVGARFWRLPEEISTGRFATTQLASGIAAQFVGGVAAVVLGILALSGVLPWTMIQVSVLALGAALLIGSDLTARMNFLENVGEEGHAMRASVGRRAALVAAGVQAILGVAAVVLAILALVNVVPVLLTELGMLAVGVAALISGSAITRRMMTMSHHTMPGTV
ncbi:MAG: hypothetical protein ABFC96_02945 [Thermoguttaceae bacterium]